MNGNDPDAICAELAQYDRDYDPTPKFRPGPEALPPGLYDFDVLEADLTTTEHSGQPIARLSLRVAGGNAAGTVIEHAYLLSSQKGVNRLGADLALVGLRQPAGEPFSRHLPAILGRLRGSRFRAAASSERDEKGVLRGRLTVNCRVPAAAAGNNLPVAQAGAAPRPPAGNVGQTQGAAWGGRKKDEGDIPF